MLRNLYKKISLVLILLTFLSVSCKKTNNNTKPAIYSDKLKMYVVNYIPVGGTYIDSFAVTYDSQDRISSLISSYNSYIYTYGTDNFSLTSQYIYQYAYHEIFFLNNESLVDSTIQDYAGSDSVSEKYIYNDGVLASKKSYSITNGMALFQTQENYTY